MDRYPYHEYTILLGATRPLAHIGVHFTHRVLACQVFGAVARDRFRLIYRIKQLDITLKFSLLLFIVTSAGNLVLLVRVLLQCRFQ